MEHKNVQNVNKLDLIHTTPAGQFHTISHNSEIRIIMRLATESPRRDKEVSRDLSLRLGKHSSDDIFTGKHLSRRSRDRPKPLFPVTAVTEMP